METAAETVDFTWPKNNFWAADDLIELFQWMQIA
jgi:hypothetical protein